MLKLKTRLALFNLLSKLVFTTLFLLFMPYLIERINLRQVDNLLVQQREEVINIISEIGIEPFMISDWDSTGAFGSYNILKEEYISLERTDSLTDANYIEVSTRLIENEEIDYRVLRYSLQVDGKYYLLEVGRSLSSIEQTGINTRKVMILFLVFIIIITFLTDLQFSRYILNPLDKITKKLKGISEPSTFDKTPVKTHTEDFDSLDRALRELMQNIDDLFQKEKEITVNVSHELLTPIAILRSRLENLLLKPAITHETESWAEDSLKTIHRLQSLVNSLLFIARIESHQYIRNESFNPDDVVKEVIDELSPIAEDAGVLIKTDLSISKNFTNANRSLIFSMFHNIVNNAIKNTGQGGDITISSNVEKDSMIVVNVSDTGNGMTEEQLKDLFLRFKSRRENSEEGAGIGLAIAKAIADFHNIEIKVTSEILKGTKFVFKIPAT